jgi:hypothetical protein
LWTSLKLRLRTHHREPVKALGTQAWLVESHLNTLLGRAYSGPIAFCETRSAYVKETSIGNAKRGRKHSRGVVYNGSHGWIYGILRDCLYSPRGRMRLWCTKNWESTTSLALRAWDRLWLIEAATVDSRYSDGQTPTLKYRYNEIIALSNVSRILTNLLKSLI